MSADQDTGIAQEQVKRREQRNATNWIATIRLRDGTEIPCNVKDVSKSGAKIGVPASYPLPETFMLRIIGRDFLCLVKLAWRRGNYAGVRIERVGKVPAAPPPAEQPTAPSPSAESPDSIEGGGIGVRSRKRGISAF